MVNCKGKVFTLAHTSGSRFPYWHGARAMRDRERACVLWPLSRFSAAPSIQWWRLHPWPCLSMTFSLPKASPLSTIIRLRSHSLNPSQWVSNFNLTFRGDKLLWNHSTWERKKQQGESYVPSSVSECQIPGLAVTFLFLKESSESQAWQHTLVNTALKRLEQEEREFEASLNSIRSTKPAWTD